jgi:hypothetical protein
MPLRIVQGIGLLAALAVVFWMATQLVHNF